jgi:hypothetical protein
MHDDGVTLDQAFRLAAGELGMASAAWLFVTEAAVDGAPAVLALRDRLGRDWPVLDAVCAAWSAGLRAPRVDAREVLPVLEGVTRIVVVGLETLWLDDLMRVLPGSVQIALLRASALEPDWPRVQSNHGGRLQMLRLADFQSWAGTRSVLLGFVYGDADDSLFVVPTWLRAAGSDVRLQFRSLLGWRVLPVPLAVYPRWLVAAEPGHFTDLLPPAA